jgi:hypothetical protein
MVTLCTIDHGCPRCYPGPIVANMSCRMSASQFLERFSMAHTGEKHYPQGHESLLPPPPIEDPKSL